MDDMSFEAASGMVVNVSTALSICLSRKMEARLAGDFSSQAWFISSPGGTTSLRLCGLSECRSRPLLAIERNLRRKAISVLSCVFVSGVVLLPRFWWNNQTSARAHVTASRGRHGCFVQQQSKDCHIGQRSTSGVCRGKPCLSATYAVWRTTEQQRKRNQQRDNDNLTLKYPALVANRLCQLSALT